MTSGTQTRDGRFIEAGWCFHAVLLGSRTFWALRWITLEKVLWSQCYEALALLGR
jgi:hypothetical protein